MYSKIVLCLSSKEDDILTRQLSMLSERHHADIERMDVGRGERYISDCARDILFITDEKTLLSKAMDRGIATNTPVKMKESYLKAMEMLRSFKPI